MANDPNPKQMDEQLRNTTRMMKEMLDGIDLEGVDLHGASESTARRFNCYGSFGTFGCATGCFGSFGTFGCRSRITPASTEPQSRTRSRKSTR